MALTNYAAYLGTKPHVSVRTSKANKGITAGRMYSRWRDAPVAGAIPGGTAACSSSTLGALQASHGNNGGLSGLATWIKTVRSGRSSGGTLFIYDRLVHSSGLSGIVTTSQTTNLPTASLTRYTDGVGVLAFIELYGAVGTTATTFTCTYTNSAGLSGQISQSQVIGGTAERAIGVMVPILLQVGDVGVRSVESVTLAATTGTAGDFGITLMKPLYAMNIVDESHGFAQDTVRDFGALFESVQADACLAITADYLGTNTYFETGSIDLIKQM